ncbi:MAG: tRNA (adenosine(37)-N6)-threonylcarbamoyltransferase complex dimerization subunit type 1 TsaB [Sphaerochaetaceae bacterium]|jgi:tRNA threonylcarbamoyladenosine biosynthesis protein TsaB
MNILAVDTSTQIMHLALQAGARFESRTLDAGLKHSENLVPEMLELCTRAGLEFKDLDLLVCTKGPGSFTGLRIAMSACKGIAFACDKPLVSISTLRTLQEPVSWFNGVVLPVIDAKKNRYYSALFRHGQRLTADMDCDQEELAAMLSKRESVLITGPDAGKFRPLLEKEMEKIGLTIPVSEDTLTKRDLGESLIRLGKLRFEESGGDDIGEGPVYIRKSDAEIALEERLRQDR